jgi:hypothetical protein
MIADRENDIIPTNLNKIKITAKRITKLGTYVPTE